MKILFLALGMTVTAQSQLLAQSSEPVEITAPVERIFIPDGYDDNDNVEVVVQGNFPNTCYQVGKISAQIDAVSKTVTLSATSLRYPGKFCLQTITPFTQSVKLGVLAQGAYKVAYADDKNVISSLKVEQRTTAAADNFLYATVENAYIEVNFDTGKQSLKLQGHFPYFFIGCMVMKEVRTYRAPSDVMVVLPIAEIVDTDACTNQPSDHSFEFTSGLPQSFKGKGLLHVRTLNGTSLNRFINIQ